MLPYFGRGICNLLDREILLSKNVFSADRFVLVSGLAVAAWFGSGGVAFAQTLGELLCNGYLNARPFGDLFAWVAYMAGSVAVLRGVFNLKGTIDNPNKGLTMPLCYLAGGAALLALPGVVGTVETTLFEDVNAYVPRHCLAGPASGGGSLDEMMVSFVNNIRGPLSLVCSIIAILAGLYMSVNGLMSASKYGTDSKAHSLHKILTNLGFGAMLIAFGSNLQTMLQTVFGGDGEYEGDVDIAWAGLAAALGADAVNARFIAAVNAALMFVQLIGLMAFVRGWLILKKVVEGTSGNATMAQGLTHILGGCLCINIEAFLTAMQNTFGLNLL